MFFFVSPGGVTQVFPDVLEMSSRPVRRVAGRSIAAGLALALLAGVLVLAAGPAAAVASRTVAFYSMDEEPGSTVLRDSSGNGRHGTIGAESTLGVVYQGRTGHRFSTHLPAEEQAFPEHISRVPHSPELNPDDGDFSFEIRYRTTYSFGNIVQKGQGATIGGYWKFEAPAGYPRCLFRGADGESRTGYNDVPLTDGEWHTVRCVRTASYVEMYVDGVRTSRLNGPTGTIANNWQMTIGGKGDCDGVQTTCDYFVGDIDYLRVEKGAGGAANQAPVAEITADCTGFLCSLSGAASTDADGAIQDYDWDFGDGTTEQPGSVTGTSHLYATEGTYTVTLTVTDDRGASSTTTRQVSVAPIPEKISYVGQATSNANAVNHTVVVPAAVRSGDTLVLLQSHNNDAVPAAPTGVSGWTPVDSQTGGFVRTRVWTKVAGTSDAGRSVTVALSRQAKGNLVVAAYRGTDGDSPVLSYAKAADVTNSATRTTPLAPVNRAQSWALSYWAHGDSASTSLTPPAGVTVRSNSSQTGSGRVTVLLADSAASVPLGSYGTKTATAASAGTSSTIWTLTVGPPPPPNIDPEAVLDASCIGLNCSLSGAGSVDPDGGIVSYDWDFGDGETRRTTTPGVDHAYPEGGSYSATLTVTDDRGGSATTSFVVTVEALAKKISHVAQATSNNNLATHTVTVPASVQPGDALLLTYGGASLAAVAAPAGVTGWQEAGRQDSGTHRTVVWSKVAQAGDAGSTVRVALSAQAKANLILSAYRGTDLDQPVAAVAKVGATTSTASRTTPTLAIADPSAWAVSYWTHRDSSTSTFTPPAGVQVRSNSSQSGGGRVTAMLADSGTEVSAASYGARTATAAAASTAGTAWTIALAPDDTPPNVAPTAALAVSCTNQVCTADAGASSDPDGSIVDYTFDFGDDTAVTGASSTAAHTYADPGDYAVTLTVTDDDGDLHSVVEVVTVAPATPNLDPVAALTVTCEVDVCAADASGSHDPDGSVVAYAFDFGDGTPPVSGGEATATHTYAEAGDRVVSVTVTDDRGGTASAQQTVTVVLPPNQDPLAEFTASCTGLVCAFDAAASDDPDGSLADYAWDFGDGETTSGAAASRSHTYAADGSYTVALTVTDNRGGTATTTRTVDVAALPSPLTFVAQATANANLATHAATVPSATQPGDTLLMLFSEAATTAVSAPTGVTGWTQEALRDSGTNRTVVWSKVAQAGDAGATVRVPLAAQTKANLVVLVYRGADPARPVLSVDAVASTSSLTTRVTPEVPVTQPSAWAVSYWTHRDSSTSTLTPPAGVQVRSNSSQTGGGRVTTLVADSAGLLGGAATYGGLGATAAAASTAGSAWTILLRPDLG